jgi:hypothetical protein
MRTSIWTVAVCTLITATLCGTAALGSSTPWQGEGLKISVSATGTTYTISSSDPCWVRHGWGGPTEPGYNSAYLHDTGWVTNGGEYFRLYIDGERVLLRADNTLVVLDAPGHHNVTNSWYVQFPAGYFAPGVYEITGEWGCRNPRMANNADGDLPWLSTVWLIVEP